ncbi:MAG: helix-turn-helix domain-containing protein [Spirochaetota bacterium]
MTRRTIVQQTDSGYAIIAGELTQNDPHRHYSMHLALGLEQPLPVTVERTSLDVTGAVIIDSWAQHCLHALDRGNALLVCFAPVSKLGVRLRERLEGRSRLHVEDDAVADTRACARAFLGGSVSAAEFCATFERALASISPGPFELKLERYDRRILLALQEMRDHIDGFLPASQVADRVALSESRFLHLFRDQTGITYRRMQLWMRLARAFGAFGSGASLTELAHSFGFADSAHFSRAFRQAFGMPPSVLVQDSTFVQVGGGE